MSNPRFRRSRVAAALALPFILAACEEHKAPAISSAPEEQHDALSGKTTAQAWLAGCYAAGGRCIGVAPDPVLACAWSSVRLLSGSADLALSDNEANAGLCDLPHGSDRQRAAVIGADLAERVYGRGAEAGPPLGTAGDTDVLYPSPEAIRVRVNGALAQAKQAERLPAFGGAAAGRVGDRVTWSSCADPICLQVEGPAIGGGVFRYRVEVRIAGLGDAEAARLAGVLAAAGLEAGALGTLLGDGRDREFVRGPACWRTGKVASGSMSAGAARAPCRAT